jgi:hypothetical protein
MCSEQAVPICGREWGEAGRKLAHDSDALLDLAQQQPAAFGGDGPAVELGPNLWMS